MSVPISADPSILSKRARSTLRILPRKGSTAWFSRWRACLAEPPAESPSTMKSSDFDGIALLAIGELAGKRRDIERALAPRELARLARGFARGCGFDHLRDDRPCFRGMLLEPGAQLLVHQVLDHRPHFGGDELVLGLGGELRVRHLDGEHAGQRLARVIARQLHLLLLGDAAVIGIVVDDAGERAAEARQMRAAVALGNVVGEAQHILVVAVVPPQGAVDRDAVPLAVDHDRLGSTACLVRSR